MFLVQVRGRSQSSVMHLGGPAFKLAMEAQARRWSQAAQSAVVGDGAAWIWNLAARDYPDAAHIVDWYHAKQHLCAACIPTSLSRQRRGLTNIVQCYMRDKLNR